MSRSSLRRYRAERLLRRDFEALRSRVLATVSLRPGARELDLSDLEACYAQAWQGLYNAVLGGQEIANPAGWLVVVTHRRAIDECRLRHDARHECDAALAQSGQEPDIAARLDDMRRLRQVFEGLRERLDRRECEAATLCYLQGLSRDEAARRMRVSTRRMRKLMEGDGRGRNGVASKVGDLLGVIRAESWCTQRASTMRALAFGVLDPDGERHRLALAHQRECPACRRYVLSLRGLAVILPPLALPAAVGSGLGAGAGVGAGAGTGGGSGAGALAGSFGGKLAAGVAALGVAAGGVTPAVLMANASASRGGAVAREARHPSPSPAPRRPRSLPARRARPARVLSRSRATGSGRLARAVSGLPTPRPGAATPQRGLASEAHPAARTPHAHALGDRGGEFSFE